MTRSISGADARLRTRSWELSLEGATLGGSAPAGTGVVPIGRWRLLFGFGVVLLVAAAHLAHNLSHGYPLGTSVLSSAAILAQCAVLTLGYALAQQERASSWPLPAGGVVVSAAFGLLLLFPLSGPWQFSKLTVAAAGVLLGFCVAGLWMLLFRLPVLAERARLHGLEVESLRREAELSRLRVHLHPHFLLNTLNAIAGLVTEDPAEATRLLAALGDLVRDALSGTEELQSFEAEVAWLRSYAQILESRHRGFLSFCWEVSEETLAARTPRLLLQPLVENAVKHGALRRRDSGRVLLRSEKLSGGTVRFVVEDNGPGLGPDTATGLGLKLVERRLALLCRGSTLRFEPLDPGTRVLVEIQGALEDRS